jgi:hypothetical protein
MSLASGAEDSPIGAVDWICLLDNGVAWCLALYTDANLAPQHLPLGFM